MAEYLFECPHGVDLVSAPMSEGPGAAPDCFECAGPKKRAYSLEGVGFAVASLRQRRDTGVETDREMRDLFLETAEEAAHPGDPDGSEAIREWNENHEPKSGNKAPLRPEMPLHSKTTFGGFNKKETK